jgi:hypothetical protein
LYDLCSSNLERDLSILIILGIQTATINRTRIVAGNHHNDVSITSKTKLK